MAETVRVVSRARVVCTSCSVADSIAARLRGLMGKRELARGCGLLLKPSASVHTCFMRFPIDVVFLDGKLEVLAVFPEVGPWRVRARRGARAVLELPAGEAARVGVGPGDRLSLEHPGTGRSERFASRRERPAGLRWPVALLVALVFLPATDARAQDCLTADPPAPTETNKLRFGITPRLAGSAGATQQEPIGEDRQKTVSALTALRPRRRKLILRLNRLFWADGRKGIRRFSRMVRRYGRAGFRSEIQVRYHPPEGREGDIEGFERFVRRAARRLGKRRAVAGFSITNEANLPISPNTSDGAYEGVVDALVRGVIVARRQLNRLGRRRLDVGFNVMWRWTPDSDRQFWEDIGAHPDAERFRRAVGYVGVQVYPGLVWPPLPLPGRTAGDEVAEALTLVRDCYMPKAKLGRDVELWVSENGYATNLGRSEQSQLRDLESTVAAVSRWSGALGITDYRWFNLRDNDSGGTDLFSAVGLLRDDYSRKPAFAAYRRAIRFLGR